MPKYQGCSFHELLAAGVLLQCQAYKILCINYTRSCARFGLYFSIFLFCQVKSLDEINTRHVFLLELIIHKPLIHSKKLLSV